MRLRSVALPSSQTLSTGISLSRLFSELRDKEGGGLLESGRLP